MTEIDVKKCLDELKNKKCEGFNRIPVCMLLDARVKLLPPLAVLFSEIYRSCKIPDQWKVAKIIPIFITVVKCKCTLIWLFLSFLT